MRVIDRSPDVPAIELAPVAPELAVLSLRLPLLPIEPLALSVAEGAVRTTVPVSLRGTAFRLASAAVCGETPIDEGVVLVLGGVVLV